MKKAFTLIEMIIALAITSVMILLLTTLISSVSRNVRGGVQIQSDDSIPEGYDGCYYYSIDDSILYYKSNEGVQKIDSSSTMLVSNYQVHSVELSSVSEAKNAIKISFYIKSKGESEANLYQTIILSTLDPNIDIQGDSGSYLCVNESNLD